MTTTLLRVEDARAHPQGELFFMKGEPGHYEAVVYNTIGLNRCPVELFEAIDVDVLRTQGEPDLPRLGERLHLPEGWAFRARTLDRDLVLDTVGLAHIVPDELENMYQGCTPDVASYDPWE